MKIKMKISKVFIVMAVFVVLLAGQVFAAESNDFEIGTQNLNNTVENSAAIGDSLIKPEKGWKRYDDANSKISYLGEGWSASPVFPEVAYKNSLHHTKNEGESFKFNFTGTRLRIITSSVKGADSNVKISIDGEEFKFDAGNTINVTSHCIFFNLRFLEDKEHQVVVTTSGGASKGIYLDAIDVDERGELKPYGPIIVKASGVVLNKNSLALEVGSVENLVAYVFPFDASSKDIKWTTSDSSIANVDESGKVTAIKAGIATITATTQDGTNLSSSCNVTVNNKNKLATSITLDKTSLEVDVDKTALIGAIVKPDDATNKAVKWTTSDNSIVTVDSTGKVTAIKAGTATITATTQDGSNLSASCKVTVKGTPGEVEATEAKLGITMVSGAVHQYDLSMAEVNKFLAWIDGRAKGEGSPYYIFEKKLDSGSIVKEYIMYDKIETFTINSTK